MHDDAIEFEEARIIIRSGFNRDGEPVFSTAFEGDMSYLQALGLIEVVKETVKDVYAAGEGGL